MLAVDVARGELAATMDDGRLQRFAGQDLDAGQLAHAYALTVHRAQGSTVARAHALEDGGGRELAYVKMSRAKERSTVYVVADDVDQRWTTCGGRGLSPSASAGQSTKVCRSTVPAPAGSVRRCRPASATPGWWPNARP